MNHWPWITFGVAIAGIAASAISFDAGQRLGRNSGLTIDQAQAVIRSSFACANSTEQPRVCLETGSSPRVSVLCGQPQPAIRIQPGAGGATK